MEVTAILPIYNERDNIRPLLAELETALATIHGGFEVIAVDDGSNDGTTQILSDLCAEKPYLKVIFFRHNMGQTAAFDAGFRNASGRLVVTMDADRQNDPRDIPKMISKINEGFDFVTGWRKQRQDGFVLRKLPSKIANFLIRRALGSQIHDLGCSLKVYRREITDELRLYGEMHRFISVLVEGIGARVAEVEVNHRPRVAGESKYGLSRTFKVMLDLLTVWFMKRFRTKPIYVFGGVGLVLLFLGTFIGSYVLYEKLFLDVWVHRNPLFLISIMFSVVGIQFLGLGLIAEIIIRTYYESRNKPAYTVARMEGFTSAPTSLKKVG